MPNWLSLSDEDYAAIIAARRWEEGSRYFFALTGTPEQQQWDYGNGLGTGHQPIGLDPKADWDFYKQDLDATAKNLNKSYLGDSDQGSNKGIPGAEDTINKIIREKAIRHGRDPRQVASDLISHPAIFPAYHWYTMDGFGPGADEMDFADAGAPKVNMPQGYKPVYDPKIVDDMHGLIDSYGNDHQGLWDTNGYDMTKLDAEPPHGTRQYYSWLRHAFVRRASESLLVGPQDAYDETDWFMRHYQNPPNEDLTDKTWYHVSPHKMSVGTVLAPMHGDTPWGGDPYDHGLQNRANWIWVEHDKDKAKAWMHWVLDHQPNCYLYRVEPHLGPYAWNGTADEGWVTDRADVVEFLDNLSQDLSFQESGR
jgi:hypothetical protein